MTRTSTSAMPCRCLACDVLQGCAGRLNTSICIVEGWIYESTIAASRPHIITCNIVGCCASCKPQYDSLHTEFHLHLGERTTKAHHSQQNTVQPGNSMQGADSGSNPYQLPCFTLIPSCVYTPPSLAYHHLHRYPRSPPVLLFSLPSRAPSVTSLPQLPYRSIEHVCRPRPIHACSPNSFVVASRCVIPALFAPLLAC